MPRYGLVGKNISHSQSPQIYKKLIGNHIQYELLDYATPDEVLPAAELLKSFDGINITAPYKTHFLKQIELTDSAKSIGAINCLKKSNGKIIGENTDYPAVIDILKRYLAEGCENVIILGDGVMAKVTIMALKILNKSFQQYSRKVNGDISNLELTEHDHQLIINTCSREFIYKGKASAESVFWDYNYNNPKQSEVLRTKIRYEDGLELLNLQAQYAIAFWSAN